MEDHGGLLKSEIAASNVAIKIIQIKFWILHIEAIRHRSTLNNLGVGSVHTCKFGSTSSARYKNAYNHLIRVNSVLVITTANMTSAQGHRRKSSLLELSVSNTA